MVLSKLIVAAALASPSLAIAADEDDWRVSEPDTTEVVLGRPREWPHPGFQLFDTCSSSGARQHTMAEMTIDFTNSCSDVMSEISARAGATANGNGWTDPHNRGHYKILATEGNLLKVQRYTGNYEYHDDITFSMTTSGTGCKVNACSVSQGNSNNDGGTNMCNMGDLFCNTSVKNTQNGVACKSVKTNLSYTIPYLECGRYEGDGQYRQHNCQDFTTTCLKNAALETTAAIAPPAEIVLGKPPEWPHPGFQLFDTCSSSGARQHTMAEMTIDFTNSCSDVMSEISARAGATANGNGWTDPHNRGHYKILATEGNLLKVQRYTGNYEYHDVITFSMTTSGTGCKVNACSVSQGNSNNDGGTNMCNMGDLFCNTSVKNTQNGVACKSVKTNLSYTIPYLECGRYEGDGQYRQHNCQDFATTCLRNAAMENALEQPAAAPKKELVVLGKPREWPHPGFQLFDTCSSSGARQHTMAEMTIDFTNSCSDVMSEISARAGATANGNGWTDPHNRGHYKILATEGNLLKVQRYTGNYEYHDVITFSMTTSGTGCKVNACSVSQGNSNNDGGTNMCNMGDLFCNTSVKNTQNGVACKSVKTNLSYTIPYLECGRYEGDGQYRQHNCQDFTTTCLRNAALESPQKVLKYIN